MCPSNFQLKEKMDSTVNKRERLQAEIVEKQKKQREHAARVRERAQRMKLGNGDENDEGLGGEMETYKPDSDGKLMSHDICYIENLSCETLCWLFLFAHIFMHALMWDEI